MLLKHRLSIEIGKVIIFLLPTTWQWHLIAITHVTSSKKKKKIELVAPKFNGLQSRPFSVEKIQQTSITVFGEMHKNVSTF